MLPEQISRSEDLKRLWNDGLELELKYGYLLVHHVPYVTASRAIKYGTIVSELTLSGEKTVKPETHTVRFIGEYPCKRDGSPLVNVVHDSQKAVLGEGLIADHMFSNKPPEGYADYWEKIRTYVALVSSEAQAIDERVTAYTSAVIPSASPTSVFVYSDTNSMKSEINTIAVKLESQTVAIVGLGGTGSYVLDFVAKTAVREIRLFDKDKMLQQNAFRAPGAVSMAILLGRVYKTDYLKGIYSNMHKNIVSRPVNIDASNVGEILNVDFVFLCIDVPSAKKPIVEALVARGISFVDVGMGIEKTDDSEHLYGIVRTTTFTRTKNDHVARRVSFSDGPDGEYDRNIQIAELNALNAALAVIKWKKLRGFYYDMTKEHNTTFTVSTGEVDNDEIKT